MRLLAFILFLALLVPPASAQIGLCTGDVAPARTVRYIDDTGTDTGACTSIGSPCATIEYADGQMNSGDTLKVRAGSYTRTDRAVFPNGCYTSAGPDTFRTVIMAYPGDAMPVFDGRNLTVSAPWTKLGSTNVWSTPWQSAWTVEVTNSSPKGRIDVGEEEYYREMITVGSDPAPLLYYNVCSPGYSGSPTAMPAGRICVIDDDPYHGSPSTLYVRLRDSSNPNSATLRMSTVPCHFNCSSNNQTAQRSGLHVKGLHLKYAADNAGGVIVLGPGVGGGHIVEDNTIEYSNTLGVSGGGSDNIIRNNTVQNNGRGNFGASNMRDSKVYGNTSGRMNLKGFRCGHGCGNKFIDGRGNVIRNNTINSPGPFNAAAESGNTSGDDEMGNEYQADGLWFDVSFNSNKVYGNRIDSTWRTGIFVEISDSNYVFSNVITNTVPQPGESSNRMPINVAGGKGNLIAYNTILGSSGCYKVRTYSRGNASTDVARSNLFINNVCYNNDWTTYHVHLTRRPGDTGMTDALLATNLLDGNAYGTADSTVNFFRYKPAGAQQLYFLKTSGTNNFSTWKTDRSYDASSFIIDQAAPHLSDPSDPVAGWRLALNSQLQAKAIAIPDTSWWDVMVVTKDIDGETIAASGGAVGADQFTAASFTGRTIGGGTGSDSEASGVYTITGTGVGTRAASDVGYGLMIATSTSTRFIWDVKEITANQDGIFGPVAGCVRGSTDADAAIVCIDVLTSNRAGSTGTRIVRMTTRASAGAQSANVGPWHVVTLPTRFKLEKSGSSWTGYVDDGVDGVFETTLSSAPLATIGELGIFVARGRQGTGSVSADVEIVAYE